MKKLTTEQFITKAKGVHGNKYSYEQVEYVNNKTKVNITCPVHGVFEQRPNDHLMGRGCFECSGKLKLTTEQFIIKAKEVHGDRYDYSLVDYKNNRTKVGIICKNHGVFEQVPSYHTQGNGCPECGKDCVVSVTTEQFITKAKEVHGDRYDYSLVDYVGCTSKVSIICSDHGTFKQTPNVHLTNHGCPECGVDTTSNKLKLTTEQFVTKAKEVHGDKYSYELVNYINTRTKVKITCPDHGVFEQLPNNHTMGSNCPECMKKTSRQEIEFTDFIRSIYDGEVITNDRTVIHPYELDVYLPEINVAFEYNGDYWHHEGITKPIGYHEMKTKRCMRKGVELHHIWEKSWMNNRIGTKQRVKGLI